MMDAGSLFLADIMLWLMYIALGVAVAAVLVSAARSFWFQNKS